MYIIIGILIFGILIAAHEWGHFVAARLCGVTVHEFSIGMGPMVWKKRGKKGTQYSLRLLPIGGYCAMEGEEEASDDPHSLSNQGFFKKLVVFAAGACMNLVVALLIMLVIYSRATGIVVPVVVGCAPEFEAVNGQALEEGDLFWSINGSRVLVANDVSMLLELADRQPIDLVVVRDGQKIAFHNVPVRTYTDTEGGTYQGYGLYRGSTVIPATLGTKLQYTVYNTVDFVRIVWFSLKMLVTGAAGAEDLQGPVGIFDTMNDVGHQSANLVEAIENLFYFGALISANLAVMNLLPIPALDGGHILFLVLDAVSRKLFKKQIPMKYEAVINMVFFALLMALMLFVTFNDVRRLFQ